VLTDALAALQGLAPVVELRGSTWVYPFVNAGHIVGIALLYGAIVPTDLRLLGFWPRLPLRSVTAITVPVAIAGLLIAVTTGFLLFSVRAVEYARIDLLQVKLLLILLALTNALALRRTTAWRAFRESDLVGTSGRLQVAGGLSVTLWLSVIVCGRLIGYLE
jgi:hypothetical protein